MDPFSLIHSINTGKSILETIRSECDIVSDQKKPQSIEIIHKRDDLLKQFKQLLYEACLSLINGRIKVDSFVNSVAEIIVSIEFNLTNSILVTNF